MSKESVISYQERKQLKSEHAHLASEIQKVRDAWAFWTVNQAERGYTWCFRVDSGRFCVSVHGTPPFSRISVSPICLLWHQTTNTGFERTFDYIL